MDQGVRGRVRTSTSCGDLGWMAWIGWIPVCDKWDVHRLSGDIKNKNIYFDKHNRCFFQTHIPDSLFIQPQPRNIGFTGDTLVFEQLWEWRENKMSLMRQHIHYFHLYLWSVQIKMLIENECTVRIFYKICQTKSLPKTLIFMIYLLTKGNQNCNPKHYRAWIMPHKKRVQFLKGPLSTGSPSLRACSWGSQIFQNDIPSD